MHHSLLKLCIKDALQSTTGGGLQRGQGQGVPLCGRRAYIPPDQDPGQR
jgi:hypothetical protein